MLERSPRRSLAKLYFDTIVFDREQLKHLVNLWGADHKAKILGLNAARLLKITEAKMRARGRR